MLQAAGSPTDAARPMPGDTAGAIVWIWRIKAVATAAACSHRASQLCGFLMLTWASIVTLGGLWRELQLAAFYSVTALLLIEALRYSTSLAMIQMLVSPIYSMQGKSSRARSTGRDWQRTAERCIAYAALVIQMLCTASGIALATWRLHESDLHVRPEFAALSFNSNAALKIFYSLAVAGNSIGAALWLEQLMMELLLTHLQGGVILSTFHIHVILVCRQQGLWAGMSENYQTFIVGFLAQELSRGVTKGNLEVTLLGQDVREVLAHGDEGLDVLVRALYTDDQYQQQASIILLSEWPNLIAVVQAPGLINQIKSNLRCTLIGHASAQFFHALFVSETVAASFINPDDIKDVAERHKACIRGSENFDYWFLLGYQALHQYVHKVHNANGGTVKLFLPPPDTLRASLNRDEPSGNNLRKRVWSASLMYQISQTNHDDKYRVTLDDLQPLTLVSRPASRDRHEYEELDRLYKLLQEPPI